MLTYQMVKLKVKCKDYVNAFFSSALLEDIFIFVFLFCLSPNCVPPDVGYILINLFQSQMSCNFLRIRYQGIFPLGWHSHPAVQFTNAVIQNTTECDSIRELCPGKYKPLASAESSQDCRLRCCCCCRQKPNRMRDQIGWRDELVKQNET